MSYQKGYNSVLQKAVKSTDRQKVAAIGSRIRGLLSQIKRTFRGPAGEVGRGLTRSQTEAVESLLNAGNQGRAIKYVNRILGNRATGAQAASAMSGAAGLGLGGAAGGAAGYMGGQRKTSSVGRQKTANPLKALGKAWEYTPDHVVGRAAGATGLGALGGAALNSRESSELDPMTGAAIGGLGAGATMLGGDLWKGKRVADTVDEAEQALKSVDETMEAAQNSKWT